MAHRILVSGIWHETSTFSPIPTDLASFHKYQYVEGGDLIPTYTGTDTEIGGFIDGSRDLDFELQPALFAAAVPAAVLPRAVLDHLIDETCAKVRTLEPLDGALIVIHGAMVADGLDEADAYFLARLREVFGYERPVVAVFDLHANLSETLVAEADVLIGYDTFPHVDIAERGREAARVLARLLDSNWRPRRSFRKLPLLSVPQTQITKETPMREIMAAVATAERRPEILLCSVTGGFPYADVAHLGIAVLAYGMEQSATDGVADELASEIWSRREAFVSELVPVGEAVAKAMAAPDGPVILVDVADNLGGGSPGDGTIILGALLDAKPRSAVVVLWDREAVFQAKACGVGTMFSGKVGGKTDDQHGPPVAVTGTVDFTGRVQYRRDGSWMTGQVVRLGDVAVINVDGVRVMVTEERFMPFDSRHLRMVGIEPEAQDIIVVKSAVAWAPASGKWPQHTSTSIPPELQRLTWSGSPTRANAENSTPWTRTPNGPRPWPSFASELLGSGGHFGDEAA